AAAWTRTPTAPWLRPPPLLDPDDRPGHIVLAVDHVTPAHHYRWDLVDTQTPGFGDVLVRLPQAPMHITTQAAPYLCLRLPGITRKPTEKLGLNTSRRIELDQPLGFATDGVPTIGDDPDLRRSGNRVGQRTGRGQGQQQKPKISVRKK